jgi:tetratricopeptide (TPR) repeat protein
MTPGKASWTVMLNTDLAVTQDDHDAKKDVAHITVKPAALPALRERLRYTFDDTQDGKTTLALEWERVRIAVPITIDTPALINASIDKAIGDAWRPHFSAASYLYDNGQLDRALALVDKSIAIQPTWRAEWLRAQVQQKKGNKAEAMASANRAQELGKGDKAFEANFKANITKTIAGWK